MEEDGEFRGDGQEQRRKSRLGLMLTTALPGGRPCRPRPVPLATGCSIQNKLRGSGGVVAVHVTPALASAKLAVAY